MFELEQIEWAGRIAIKALKLRAGEMIALIGPNGAGKSSLLMLLAGLVQPDRGQILLNGTPLSRLTPQQQARLRAYLPQDTRVSMPLTVDALVSLGELPGRPADPKRKEEILCLLALASLRTKPVQQLSGGELQRAQLARVLLQAWGAPDTQPHALLLDESLNALDIHFQQKLLTWLNNRCQAGELAVVWASHDLNQALQFSHCGWLVAEHRLLAAAPISEMASSGLLSQTFHWPLQLHSCDQRTVILPAQAAP